METEVERSVEDRIGDLLLGPEEAEADVQEVEAPEVDDTEEVEAAADDEPAEEPEESPEFVEMEIDGKLYEIPVELKDHVLRQQDYTQKTQEVAAQRREAEVLQANVLQQQRAYEFANSIQDEILQAQQIDAAIPQWNEYLRNNIDSLSATEIEKIRLNVDELKTQREALTRSVQQKQQEFQQATEQSEKELRDKSTEILKQRYPNWSPDAATDYAINLGFTPDQVAVAQLDPRQMELVHKAMLYDQLQEGKAAAVAKVKDAPKIKTKSRNPMPKEVGRKLNFQKKFKNADAKTKEALAKEELFSRLG